LVEDSVLRPVWGCYRCHASLQCLDQLLKGEAASGAEPSPCRRSAFHRPAPHPSYEIRYQGSLARLVVSAQALTSLGVVVLPESPCRSPLGTNVGDEVLAQLIGNFEMRLVQPLNEQVGGGCPNRAAPTNTTGRVGVRSPPARRGRCRGIHRLPRCSTDRSQRSNRHGAAAGLSQSKPGRQDMDRWHHRFSRIRWGETRKINPNCRPGNRHLGPASAEEAAEMTPATPVAPAEARRLHTQSGVPSAGARSGRPPRSHSREQLQATSTGGGHPVTVIR